MLALFAAVALDAVFSTATLSGAHVGALVIDAQSGRTVYARNADDAFIPASTMKLIVGSAALDVLGNAFSFTTTLETDGSTLYLKGGGDPLLGAQDFAQGVDALEALKMTAFPDGVVGDDTRYTGARYPDGWQVDDLPYDYAAPVCALSFNENRFNVQVTPGSAAGTPTSIAVTPVSSVIPIANRSTTGAAQSEDSTALTWIWNPQFATWVTGSAPARATDVLLDGAVFDPRQFTVDALVQALKAQKIDARSVRFAPVPSNARVLWQHHSPALPALLADMWQPSDNLLAETLLEELGVANPGNEDTRTQGIARERTWLASIGIDPKTLTIADGSGMSSYDRVTPRALVAILAHDWNAPSRPEVLAALPVAGKSGTLKTSFTAAPLAGNVIAKTGTSNHTRTLAGFLQTPRSTLVFALMVNDWMDAGAGASDRLRTFQQAFLTGIREGAGGVQ